MLTGLLLLLAAQQAGDSVLFQCRTNGARVVYLAGDFNDWAYNQNGRITDPATAMTESNGVWRKAVKLEPGTWRFKFCVDGEPTASLDPDIADKVRKMLRRIQREKGITMIYTSHNMRDVQEVCDRVLFMHKGRIIAEGTPQQVMDKFNQKSLEDVFISVARGGDVLMATETFS